MKSETQNWDQRSSEHNRPYRGTYAPPKIDPRAHHRTKSLTQAREEGEKAQRDSEYQPDQDGLTLQHVQEEIEEEQDKNPNT